MRNAHEKMYAKNLAMETIFSSSFFRVFITKYYLNKKIRGDKTMLETHEEKIVYFE